MFSLLYCSLNRGVNIAQLRWGQLVEMTGHTGSPALFMHASMGKTGGLSDTRQLIYLPHDGMAALGTFSTLQLYRLFMRANEHSEVPYATRTGFMSSQTPLRLFQPTSWQVAYVRLLQHWQ